MTAPLERKELLGILSHLSGVLNAHQGVHLGSDQIWEALNGEKGLSLDVPVEHDPLTAFREPRTCLKRFTDMLQALRALANTLEEENTRLEKRIDQAALHHGICRLPDELLSIIMGFVVGSTFDEARILSHVCARFRSVILSTPRIWANCELSPLLKSKQNLAIVHRSKGIPLKASMEVSQRNLTMGNKSVLLHSELFEELHFTTSNDAFFVIPHDYLNGILLPSLRSLFLRRYTGGRSFGPNDNNGTPLKLHFYKSWIMPQLRNLESNFVPLPMLGKTLLHCKLAFKYDTVIASSLLKFLASCPLLESLDIVFTGPHASPEAMSDSLVVLKNLNSLTLQVSEFTPPSLLSRILDRLSLKKLSSLSLRLDVQEDEFDYEEPEPESQAEGEYADYILRCAALLRFIPRHQTLQKLSVLVTIELHGALVQIPSAPYRRFDEVLTTIPSSLRTLELSTPLCGITVRWETGRRGRSIPPVDYLRLSNGEELSMDFLRTLRGNVLQGGKGPKRIEVEHCPLISENKLQALFPSAEITCRL